MTRTARVLLVGPVVALGLWMTASAAVPAEPTATHPRASARGAEVLTPPVADVVAPLVLAALCGTAVALFSAGPRGAARTRPQGQRGRG